MTRVAANAARRSRPLVIISLAVLSLVASIALTGCSALVEPAPTPTPQPFPGITGELGRVGVDVLSWTAGDPGCDDPTLSPTAIRFDAQGLDQPTPATIRIYIFKNREAWTRRSADVERCVIDWAADVATVELLQVSPYVVAGLGPWPPQFDAAMREGITAAAGTGD